MFVEKKRLGVSPRLFTANGDANGTVTVSNASGFFVKQIVFIQSDTLQPREYEIKRFLSKTSFKVGPKGTSITTYSDISDFLVSDNAKISAPEQNRPGITREEHERAVYAEEPIVAKRSVLVDEFGEYFGEDNPIPVTVDNEINIQNANINVKISHLQGPGNTPADSTRIGDGIQTITGTNTNIGKYLLDTVSVNKLIRREFDDIEVLNKNSEGDPLVIVFRSSGNLVATLNLTYDLDGDFKRAEVTYS